MTKKLQKQKRYRFTERQKGRQNRFQTEHSKLKKKTQTIENQLSNPGAKNCKEPSTPSETQKGTESSWCGVKRSHYVIASDGICRLLPNQNSSLDRP